MAKARDVPVDPDEPFAAAAARIVAVRASELLDQAEGVLDTSDIERVHDMRVATRRLRAVLEIFAPCFPRKDHREVLRDVKALADALGARRDPDVHVDGLLALAGAVPPGMRGGVEHLIELQRTRQAAGNAVLAAELARMGATDLRGRLDALVAAADVPAAGMERA